MRDAIALRRLGHRLPQRHGRDRMDIVPVGLSEAARRGERNGLKRKIGVRDIEAFEHIRERGAQIRRRDLGRGGQRRAEQDDPEIGVGSGCGARRRDGIENALSDARARLGERARGGLGAAQEIGDRHAMAVGENMHVAGLGRRKFIAAGRHEGGRDGRRGHGHNSARCTPLRSSAATRSAASAAAIFAGVTFCTPAQAGMLLTSSTLGRPSAP